MKYSIQPARRRTARRLLLISIVAVSVLAGATIAVRHIYFENLKPVSATSQKAQLITIKNGATVDDIAQQLHDAGLIRSTWAFRLYVSSKEVRNALEAGTYSFEKGQSVPEIVSQLTHGKVATDLVTILPGQRIDQIKTTLINYGFSKEDVASALNPSNYPNSRVLVDKPAQASLEGYIYPDSYQKTGNTTPQQIISAALDEMDSHITPELRADFAQQGLSTYEGMILASVVEQEVSHSTDRAMAAQVFIKRLHMGMMLGSDVTALYGSRLGGQAGSLTYDSPYNTLLHTGLPPTPISNVSDSSLQAVAHPANTDYLYFVAGDDGVTHFTHTLEEHEAAAKQYCHKLCGQ